MKKILLTRMLEDNADDREYFEGKGFEVLEIPLIGLKPRQKNVPFEFELNECDWLFLTSQHAATFLLEQALNHGLIEQLESKKIAVIGTKTEQVLLANHLTAAFSAPSATKKSLFHSWSQCYSDPVVIFYPKSNLADTAGESLLKAQGHILYTPILYDNFFPKDSKQTLYNYLNKETIAAVYFASPSLWRRFYSVFSELKLAKVPTFYCLGETTRQAIRQDGYDAVIK
jgi:uroporphyrinogen-III synthase